MQKKWHIFKLSKDFEDKFFDNATQIKWSVLSGNLMVWISFCSFYSLLYLVTFYHSEMYLITYTKIRHFSTKSVIFWLLCKATFYRQASIFRYMTDLTRRDEGWYFCEAENAYGKSEVGVYLNVLEVPGFQTTTFKAPPL